MIAAWTGIAALAALLMACVHAYLRRGPRFRGVWWGRAALTMGCAHAACVTHLDAAGAVALACLCAPELARGPGALRADLRRLCVFAPFAAALHLRAEPALFAACLLGGVAVIAGRAGRSITDGMNVTMRPGIHGVEHDAAVAETKAGRGAASTRPDHAPRA